MTVVTSECKFPLGRARAPEALKAGVVRWSENRARFPPRFIFRHMTLHRQPGRTLASVLADELSKGPWRSLDAAVAWVRRSGTHYLSPPLAEFLGRDKSLRLIVGTDLFGTSIEGLQDLLTLTLLGDAKVFVQAPNRNSTFHPKVYLFQSAEKGKLIVGSSNLTGGGLATNREVSLEIAASLGDKRIAATRAMLKELSRTHPSTVRMLDQDVLDGLVADGLVLPEKRIREEQAAKEARLPRRSRTVFARAGRAPRVTSLVLPSRVLLVRPRRGRGGTQAQLPFRLTDTAFFSGQAGSTNRDSGEFRPFVQSHAGGGRNTLKFELSESLGMEEPIVRFLRRPNGLVHEIRDASDAPGSRWKAAIEIGFASNPPQSRRTSGELESTTWWRFV